MIKKWIGIGLVFAATCKPVLAGPPGHDVLLGSAYGVKAAIPLALIPGLASLEPPHGERYAPLAIGAGLVAGMTVPNSMVLIEAAAGNAEGVERWRKITFWSDATMATAAAGMGSYALADLAFGLSEDNGWAGIGSAVFFAAAVQMALFAYWDTKPFDIEAKHGLSVSTGLVPMAGGVGMLARGSYSF